MNNERVNEVILQSMCMEFQSIWIIHTQNQTMETYYVNEGECIPQSVETARAMNHYDTARLWYIQNHIVENDRERMTWQTSPENILKATEGNVPYFVEYNRVKEGRVNYNQLYYARLKPEPGEPEAILLGFRDIDIRKKAEIDELTGLYTRQSFFERAEELVRSMPETQFDVMLSDIVDFKEINELYGSDVGDAVLQWAGAFLASGITETFLAGRYAGDQMVVLAPHEMIQHISSPESHKNFLEQERNNGLPEVTIKFGIYENVKRTKTILSTCDKAHAALNSIKHRYDCYFAYYDDTIRKSLENLRRIESCMNQALDEEQFKVYYQPKHNARTGALVGAEALVRWIHPEYGFMSPGDFIPIFERNGFVKEVDSYVWRRTCKNLRRWMDKGIRTVPISVNCSKLTFELPNLLNRMQNAVEMYELNPKQLHIEITETLMTNDAELLVKKLSSLRMVGYQIELDDFGSGYSSLNVLSALPLDVVKLDMSFMKEFGDEKRSKVLVACINLAKELGYKTISEGVETEDQKNTLGILGVDNIQGYYFSKPMPEDEFEEYMRKFAG